MTRGWSWGRRVPLLGLSGLLVWNALWFTPFVVDDAFISMRYARNLVAGNGLVYNPGERVEGFSNFLWVLVEAVLLALGVPVVTGVQALGLLAGAATVALTFALASQVSQRSAGGVAPRIAPWIATGLLAANSSLALWSVAGLETSLLAALLVAAVWRFERELAPRRARRGAQAAGGPRVLSAVLFALAWTTRPEAPAYLTYVLVRRFAGKERAPPGRADLVWALTLVALVLPYEVFGLVYYGGLVPATHAAKVGGGLPFTAAGLTEFATGQGWALPALLVVGGLGCALGWRRWPPAAWVPLGCGLIFVAYAGKDWMPRFRFFVPFLPFLCLSLAHGLTEWLERARVPAVRAVWTLVLAALCLGYADHQMTGSYTRGEKEFGQAGGARGFWPAQVAGRLGTRVWPQETPAWWILQSVPEGETVAIGDIGFPGYLGDNPIWDLRGLVTPATAAWRHDRSEAGREAMLAALQSARPACILIPSLGRNREQLMGRLEGDLETAAWLREGWQRREDRAARVIVYLRRDVGTLDRRAVRRRVRAAFERLPGYDSELARRGRELLGL